MYISILAILLTLKDWLVTFRLLNKTLPELIRFCTLFLEKLVIFSAIRESILFPISLLLDKKLIVLFFND